ncbi:MAG: hypothetical protein O3C28_06300, partial [Proteobacteria bacterium]|nr:hypothetical protein [Pseudomonadota bacterium]
MLNASHLFRILILNLILTISVNANANTSFTFDGPAAQGWTVLDYQNGRIFSNEPAYNPGLTSVGNPTDAILANDPNAEQGARFSAPAPFIGNAASLVGGTLMFDLTVAENFDAMAYTLGRALGLVLVERGVEALIYTGALPDDTWTTYTVNLGPNTVPLTLSPEPKLGGFSIPDVGFWAYVPDITAAAPSFSDPTLGQFNSIFGAVDRFTIVGEVLDGPDDALALDNVNLTVVPVPAALPLMLSALFGVVVAS